MQQLMRYTLVMKTATVIRLTITPEVSRSLARAKRQFPALSDPEILKVGLSRLAVGKFEDTEDLASIQSRAAHALNIDGYIDDPSEDIYHKAMGKPNNFAA